MARFVALLLAFLLACAAPAALARKSSARPRRLNGKYYYSPPYSSPSSGSSPTTSTPTPSSPSPVVIPSTPTPSVPYTAPSTPTPSTPSPVVTPSTPSPVVTPSTPSPVTVPPVTSTPSPVTLPPVTSSPTGGYGGYGSRSGSGTSGYWSSNPSRVPRILSLFTALAKIFGQQALKFFGKRLSLYGAIKDTSPDAMSSLAREGSASLINAYAYNDFPLTVTDVVNEFNNALMVPDTAGQQAARFQSFNEAV